GLPVSGEGMSQPARSKTPGLAASAMRIFDLSLGQMLWSRRSVFLGVLLGGPVLLAVVLRIVDTLHASGFKINGAAVGGSAIFGMMIWLLFIRFIVPVLGVFYGTSLIADEVDDKTITYLFTRPIPRSAILLGKYLAYLACTVLLVLPSVMLVFFLIVPTGGGSIGEAFPSLLADLGMLAVGLASYGAVFALVGTWLKRPLVVGLVFAFGWEPAVLLFPGYLKRLTVAYYMQALVTHEMPQDSAVSVLLQVFHEVPSVTTSLLCLAAIITLTLWLAGRAVEQREYVLEQ
ncbi:MAG TPA: ABC transporter permease, partial [Vicinamibacterales bacterium]|nr:ABC transporter permease [Vicinamibacterales bacterium]